MKNLFFLIIFTLAFAACGEPEVESNEPIIRPVKYAKVLKTGGEEITTLSGAAQSSKETKMSFKVAGTVNRLLVKVGDKVSRGQSIATIDAIDYSVQYDQAVAQLKSSETQIKATQTQLVTSKSTFERVEKLYENNSVPLSEFEQARASYEAAQSQYDAAVAQVSAAEKAAEAAKNQVNYARLTAPFSGIITMINVEENELVASGTPVAIISAEGNPEVRVGVPEVFISKVKKGQKVNIAFSTLDNQVFSGVVNEVSFSSNEASTYPVIVQIQNPSQDIRPGMAANVSFAFSAKNVDEPFLVVPAKAVGEGPEGNFVFQLEADGNNYKVVKTNVKVGDLHPGGFEIVSGLSENNLVATAGLKSLLNGMTVKLMEH